MRKPGSVGQETAKLIRQHAVALIAAHGYAAMNLRQLAEGVDLTVGSLYNHIGSKQDLLKGLLKAVMEDLLAAVEERVLPYSTPIMQFQAFVQLHLQFHIDRKNDVLIATTELRSLSAINLHHIIKLRNRYEATLGSILRRGKATRVFNVRDVKFTTLAIIPMLTGVSQWYRPGGRLSRERLIEEYTSICLALVGADRKAEFDPTLLAKIDDEGRPADFGAVPRRRIPQ